MRKLVTQIYASFWKRKCVCRWNKFRMSFKNRRFSSKKNSRHNYCKCLVFLQRMLIFISKIMDILVQIQKKICWEPIFRFFLRGQHSTNFKKKYKSTHFNFTVYSTRMTEEELWLHNAALLDVQFCGNEKEVGIIYLFRVIMWLWTTATGSGCI